MKAMVLGAFGPPSQFEFKEVERPKVPPGHLLIEVRATSVNQIDCKIRSGAVPSISPDLPAILHGDVAGVVAEVGAGMTQFEVGEEVYACGGGVKGTHGALAEYMLVPADAVAEKPRSLSFKEAAALPLVAITAWTALFLKGEVERGEHLLIHGGVGGVGHIALQLAKEVGAKVVATVGSESDVPLAQSLGAGEVILYRKEEVEHYVKRLTQGKGFPAIFDTVGGKNLDLSFQAAAPNGRVMTTAARSTHDLTPLHQKGLSLHVVFMLLPLLQKKGLKEQGEILKEVAQKVDQGKLKPLLDPKPFSIREIGRAHEYLESGQAKGKVVATW